MAEVRALPASLPDPRQRRLRPGAARPHARGLNNV